MGGATDLPGELAESRAREAALAEVLGVMRRTPPDLDRVLKTILDRAARLCGAERASIHLLDGQVYRTAAFWGPPNPEYERVAYDTTRTPGRETLIGRTALDRAVIHIPDVLADPEYTATELQRLGGYRTMLGVPLFRGDAVAGVFVLTRNEVRAFSDREIALVHAFADQAVVAVENVRLFNETKEALERQTALSEILGVISSSQGDIQPTLDVVARNAARYCGAEEGAVSLVRGAQLYVAANWGALPSRGTSPEPIDRTTTLGVAILDRKTVQVVDLQTSEEYPRARERAKRLGFHSIAVAPMLRADRVLGTISLRRAEPRPFTERQVELLQAFADQAAIAIENVRLFDETKESLEQQTAIASVLGAISRSAFDLDLVLTTIIENAVRLTDAANGTILALEGSTARWLVTTDPESDGRVTAPLERNRRSLTGRVLLERRTVQIDDIGSDPEYDLTGYTGPACTMLGVPLQLRGELIGVLIVRRRVVRAFTADQIRIAETFADQAAIAMDNVRLFTETKDQLERETATSEILRVTAQSTFELQPVLDAVIANATHLAGAENGFVYQVDGQFLRMTAAVGEKAELMRDWQRTNPIRANDRGTSTGRAFSEGRTVHIPDVFADPEYTYWEAQRLGNFRTLLTVPLVRQGAVIGVIAMWRTHIKPFSDKEINLVKTFADQAAIAIANVELFRTVERQREELSRFLSPQVAALITSEQGAKMLEGHRRQITVVFCDLRGFTAFAETAEPEEVLGVLRDYHRAMGELIVQYQGTLEHFAGDGMMVFFNDPLPVEHHELQAVRMACAMRDSFEDMARAWQKRGYELGFGVGIATGYATLGRIGFEGRYDYGAVGNVVILAQRLSAEAKAGQILLSQRVHAAVESDAETTAVGELALKGFTRPVPAFAAESANTPTPARP